MIYVDFKGKIFFSEFKDKALILIKDKIGLDGEIGGIEGGVFRGIVLKDVKLYRSATKDQIFFSSEAVNLDYRLWDIAINRVHKLERITFVSPRVYFSDTENKLLVPKVVEPAWKQMSVSIKDGSFYSAQRLPFVSDLNGNFTLDESGIESRNVSASVFGQRFAGRGKIGFPVERSALQLEGAIKGKGYSLKAQLNGVPDKMFVRGSFDVLKKPSLNFAGNIEKTGNVVAFNDFDLGGNLILNGLFEPDKKGFSINLFPKDNEANAAALGELCRVEIRGDYSKLPYFILNINANHLKLLGFDLLSNYNINGKLNYDNDNKLISITGDFSTSGSVINYNPMREAKGSYELLESKIRLQGVNYGDVAFVNGSVSFEPPYERDFYIKFKGAQLGGLTDLTMDKGMVSGLVFGDMHLYGDLNEGLKIDGQLEFLNGNINVVKYNSAKLTLKGRGAMLEFVNSKVYTGEEVFVLEGKMDLRDMGSPRAFRYVTIKSDPQTIVWAGSSVTKGPEGEEVVFGKDISEQFRVNFRTYESQQPQLRPKQDEMEFEYKVGKPGGFKLRMKENDDFFGVERKVRF